MNKRDTHAGLGEFGGDDLEMIVAADDIEAAFGRALAALFRNEAARVRPRIEGDRHHLVGRRHFEIQRLRNLPSSAAPCPRREYGGGPRANGR